MGKETLYKYLSGKYPSAFGVHVFWDNEVNHSQTMSQ